MPTNSSLLPMLQSLVGLLGVLATALGAVVAASFFKRSHWAGIVAVGFALQVLGMLASQFMVPILVSAHAGDMSGLARGTLGISIFGVIARIVVVGGVIGLLVEFSRAKRRVERGDLGSAA